MFQHADRVLATFVGDGGHGTTLEKVLGKRRATVFVDGFFIAVARLLFARRWSPEWPISTLSPNTVSKTWFSTW